MTDSNVSHPHAPQTREEALADARQWISDSVEDDVDNYDVEGYVDTQYIFVEGRGWFPRSFQGHPIFDPSDMTEFEAIAHTDAIEEHRKK